MRGAILGTVWSVLGAAIIGLGACETQERGSASTVVDMRGSEPVPFQGVLWSGEGTLVGVLDVTRSDGFLVVESALSTSAFSSTQRMPIAAITTQFEVDCGGQRYRKLSDIHMTAAAEPVTKITVPEPRWHAGLADAFKAACGDASVRPTGPRFETIGEFVALYDDEASRLGLQPTVTPSVTPLN